jgi:membrane-associated HD superfamily phosphohydrolase
MKRLLDNQFDECDLTMRDIEQIEKTMMRTVMGIYHGRIAYPTDQDDAPPAQAMPAQSPAADVRQLA